MKKRTWSKQTKITFGASGALTARGRSDADDPNEKQERARATSNAVKRIRLNAHGKFVWSSSSSSSSLSLASRKKQQQGRIVEFTKSRAVFLASVQPGYVVHVGYACDTNPFRKQDDEVSEFHRFKDVHFACVVLLVDSPGEGARFRLDQWREHGTAATHAGFLQQVLNRAGRVSLYNNTTFFALLRKYYPSQDVCTVWRQRVFDVFQIIKQSSQEWVGLQPLQRSNRNLKTAVANACRGTMVADSQECTQAYRKAVSARVLCKYIQEPGPQGRELRFLKRKKKKGGVGGGVGTLRVVF